MNSGHQIGKTRTQFIFTVYNLYRKGYLTWEDLKNICDDWDVEITEVADEH